jgi:hypothetical protein
MIDQYYLVTLQLEIIRIMKAEIPSGPMFWHPATMQRIS